MTVQAIKPSPVRGLRVDVECPRCPTGTALGYVAGGHERGDQSRALLRCLTCGREFCAAIVLRCLDEARTVNQGAIT